MSKSYKLGDICTIGSSKRVHLSDYVEKGIPFYRSKEIIELANGQNISDPLYISNEQYSGIKRRFPVPKKNDILITSVGTIGISYLVKDENFYFKDGNLTWLRDINKNITDINFLIQWLKSNFFKRQILNNNIGAVQKAITIDYLKKVNISLPELISQQKIASVLSVLNSKIELNNKINSELELMIRTLYNYWFVQFDFPDKNGKPYKSSGGEMIWNDELKREIPNGWDNANLLKNSFTKIIKPGIKKFEGFKKYLATADINGREIGKGSDIAFDNRESRANMQPIKNSLWFAKMKFSKKHLFIGEFAEDIVENCILSTGFMGLKCEEVALEFLAGFISADIFEVIKDKISHGATMQGIGNDDLKFIKIIIPDEKTLLAYGNLTRDLYKKMDIHRQENKRLAELRDWLLPMLMNGQVRVA